MKKNESEKPAYLKPKKVFLIIVLAIIFLIVAAAIIYPFLPLLKYYSGFYREAIDVPGESINDSYLKQQNIPLEPGLNFLSISKIGVFMPIVEGEDESALNKGAWRMPETSTPNQGSNTVITGHRFQFLPPHERTFYLLDKLEIGDTFYIFWQGEEYRYRVFSIEIVEPTALEVLDPTETSIVTLFTCHPLFSIKQRLIVRGELIE